MLVLVDKILSVSVHPARVQARDLKMYITLIFRYLKCFNRTKICHSVYNRFVTVCLDC